MIRAAGLAAGLSLAAALSAGAEVPRLDLERAEGSLRIASFNVALSRRGAGLLIAHIAKPHPQVQALAEIVLTVRPDVLLLNEFDHDPEGRALDAFAALLAEGVGDLPGLDYRWRFAGPSNTGEPTGIDLDRDGRAAGPRDAHGFGRFPGQYGMALLSRLPIDEDAIRTYRLFRWSGMPGALRPVKPDGTPHHANRVWSVLRLSSKSHWDVPVRLPDGGRLHLLAAHPTPPVFDGPEDLNGRRNADEIRLLAAMIDGPDWLSDDQGHPAGLSEGTPFVVLGDLNADPEAGESRAEGIATLLADPRLQDPRPAAPGGPAAADPGGPGGGQPELDTADFREEGGPGNLRVDYVLPSTGLEVTGAGVFWPHPGDPLSRLTEDGASSDHRLVWVDIRP